MPPDIRNPATGHGRASRNVQVDKLNPSIPSPRFSCKPLPGYYPSSETDRFAGLVDWLRDLEDFARDIDLKSALTVALVHDDLVAMVSRLEDRIFSLECDLDEATPAKVAPAATERATPTSTQPER
jgi:hypothetical protein